MLCTWWAYRINLIVTWLFPSFSRHTSKRSSFATLCRFRFSFARSRSLFFAPKFATEIEFSLKTHVTWWTTYSLSSQRQYGDNTVGKVVLTTNNTENEYGQAHNMNCYPSHAIVMMCFRCAKFHSHGFSFNDCVNYRWYWSHSHVAM